MIRYDRDDPNHGNDKNNKNNPRHAGEGGGGETASCTFPTIAKKTERNRVTKLSEPLPTSILHMLTKEKFRTYDRSAVSDVMFRHFR